MKAILFVLFVLFITALMQPAVNVSFAQNCTCAECGYPCKTPMVHDSKCKYKNNRQPENKTEINSENKSVYKSEEPEATDMEFRMLMINSTIKSVSGDAAIDNTQKEKLLLEQYELLSKITPEDETQKLLFDDVMEYLQNILKDLKK